MCPGLRDIWGIYGVEALHVSWAEGHVGHMGVEARHVSGFEGHVGQRGRCWVEAVWRFGGIVAGLLRDCCNNSEKYSFI